jgi:hypothetical protein
MSSELEEISQEVERISAKLEGAKDDAKRISFTPSEKKPEDLYRLAEDRSTQFGREFEPLPPDAIQQGAMTTIHGFSRDEGSAWNKIVREFIKLYKRAVGVARTHGPHVQAYNAALSTLYRLELAAIAGDPLRACDRPEPLLIERKSTRRSDNLHTRLTHAFKWKASSCPSRRGTRWRKSRRAELRV